MPISAVAQTDLSNRAAVCQFVCVSPQGFIIQTKI